MAGTVLQIDTELLTQSAEAARNANEAITQAMNLINQVTEHQDWVCSKRDAINDYARSNREAIGILQQNANSFYGAVKMSADRFAEKEQEISNRSNKLDEIISSVIVKVPPIGGGIGSATGSVGISSMQDIGSSLGGHSSGGGTHG